MVKPVVRKSSSKNPPIFSHEFIIQNHADIVSCVAMVFVIGIMMQATAPIASIFIALQHNVTEATTQLTLYRPGVKDWCGVFFYGLISIVIHAILQEYVIDKISKRLHLSKSKLAIFSTSGQLVTFYLASTIWGLDIIIREHYIPDLSLLWLEYPAPLSFMLKLFMIIQLAYSLHELPEIYFQRTKREEYLSKAVKAIAALVLIAVPYFLNFNRLLVCLLVLHYTSELFQHSTQLAQIFDKEEKLSKVFTTVSNVVLVLVRLASIIVSVLTLWYGLALESKEQINLEEGNYNIAPVRLVLLTGVCLLQAYLMFSFITQQIAKVRESKAVRDVAKPTKQKKEKTVAKKGKKEKEESDLPEVDQNTNKNLRSRVQKVK